MHGNNGKAQFMPFRKQTKIWSFSVRGKVAAAGFIPPQVYYPANFLAYAV